MMRREHRGEATPGVSGTFLGEATRPAIRAVALEPIDRITVKCLVKRSLKRAEVKSTYRGAHILRHSAATSMLRHGVSLAGVSAVLRHRSPAMTVHYAKVDRGILETIAQPWPGSAPC